MDLNQLLQAKREQILAIAARRGARNVRVFGSVARGEADEKSDVDLLVSLEPGVTLLKHAALVRELEAMLGCRVDVVSDRALRPRNRERILNEAITL